MKNFKKEEVNKYIVEQKRNIDGIMGVSSNFSDSFQELVDDIYSDGFVYGKEIKGEKINLINEGYEGVYLEDKKALFYGIYGYSKDIIGLNMDKMLGQTINQIFRDGINDSLNE